jgi:energy-coupling factor transporter ATP-binding protein EcfA2/5S rRNA maturation endonuclease (ribonuclease M5)
MFDANDLEDVLSRLEEVEKRGGGFLARCPAHDDHRPSLKIDERGGKVLLKCYADCSYDEILGALDGRENGWRGHASKVEATYDYVDEDGGLLFQVVRESGKRFKQRRQVSGSWVYNLDGARRVLYRLPRVLDAVERGERVYLCEGEKDVEAIERAGGVATCNPGGAGKWRDEYTHALEGADVTIVHDRDDVGRKHARQVAQALTRSASSVRLVEALTGKDAADHLAAGHTLEDFREVPVARSGAIDGASFLLDADTSIRSVWGRDNEVAWAQGETLLLAGPQGVGKSTLLQQLALARIGVRTTPLLFMPVAVDERPLLYIAADRPSQIRRSLGRMVSEDDRKTLSERLIVWQGPLPFNLSTEPEKFAPFVAEFGVGTVCIDSLKDVAHDLSKDETGSRVNAALQETLAYGIEVAASHHQRKAQANNKKPTTLSDVYGSTWITAGVGSVLLLWGEAGDSIVEFLHLKQPAEEIGPLKVVHDHATGTTDLQPEFDVMISLRSDRGMTREDGAPVHADGFTDAFQRLAKAAKLPRIRFHDLRHTHATLALAAGVHPKVVSERLGHASVTITLDTYSHAIPAMQETAAELVASLVFEA